MESGVAAENPSRRPLTAGSPLRNDALDPGGQDRDLEPPIHHDLTVYLRGHRLFALDDDVIVPGHVDGLHLRMLPEHHEWQSPERLCQREWVNGAHVQQSVIGYGVRGDEEATPVRATDGGRDHEQLGVNRIGVVPRDAYLVSVKLVEQHVHESGQVQPQARALGGQLVFHGFGGDARVETCGEGVVEVRAIAHAYVKGPPVASREHKHRIRHIGGYAEGAAGVVAAPGGYEAQRGPVALGATHYAVEHFVY